MVPLPKPPTDTHQAAPPHAQQAPPFATIVAINIRGARSNLEDLLHDMSGNHQLNNGHMPDAMILTETKLTKGLHATVVHQLAQHSSLTTLSIAVVPQLLKHVPTSLGPRMGPSLMLHSEAGRVS